MMISKLKDYKELVLEGDGKIVRQVQLEKDPMKIGGLTIEYAVNEKCLGDYVSELGCRQSIDDTIKERMRKLTSKANDIIMLADAPIMGADGTSMAAIKLYEATVVPALLFNSESWIGITEAPINELQGIQDKFLRKLMHLAISTPKAILPWEGEWN